MIAGGPDPNNPIIIIQAYQNTACLMVNTLNDLFSFEPWTAVMFQNSSIDSIQTITPITSTAGSKY